MPHSERTSFIGWLLWPQKSQCKCLTSLRTIHCLKSFFASAKRFSAQDVPDLVVSLALVAMDTSNPVQLRREVGSTINHVCQVDKGLVSIPMIGLVCIIVLKPILRVLGEYYCISACQSCRKLQGCQQGLFGFHIRVGEWGNDADRALHCLLHDRRHSVAFCYFGKSDFLGRDVLSTQCWARRRTAILLLCRVF